MKVYLIKTPEYETEYFRDVCDFLNSFDGALEFVSSEYKFQFSEFNFFKYSSFNKEEGVKKLLFEIEQQEALSWDELFSVCSFYRNHFKIDKEDFVVLLTKRCNKLNWFSHNDSSRNVFIHTANWDKYINVHHKYPVAYQVIENVMQSLMNVTLEVFPSQYIHEKPRGCMNDFCEDKEQIILKLQTANICAVCAICGGSLLTSDAREVW